jgi:hypothetical protein
MQQLIVVYFFFWLELEKPTTQFRKRIQFPGIHENPNSLPAAFLIEDQGEPSKINNPQPSISNGTGGQNLDGIGQARPGLTEGVMVFAVCKMLACQIHHETSKHHTRRHIAMEVFDNFKVPTVGMAAYGESLLALLFQSHLCRLHPAGQIAVTW